MGYHSAAFTMETYGHRTELMSYNSSERMDRAIAYEILKIKI